MLVRGIKRLDSEPLTLIGTYFAKQEVTLSKQEVTHFLMNRLSYRSVGGTI